MKYTFLLVIILCNILIVGCVPEEAVPTPSEPSSSCGDCSGIVVTDINSEASKAHDVIQQADGKIVSAGFSGSAIELIRYNSDGSQDVTFGSSGSVHTVIGAESATANAIIQQQDGKLVIAGNAGPFGTTDVLLVRYNIDGSLDNTFGTGGIVTTHVNADRDSASSIIQQADGKLVIAGSTTTLTNSTDVLVARYNSDGTLDVSFALDGIMDMDLATGSDSAQSVIQQSDGKIVITGSSVWGVNHYLILLRLHTDGRIDPNFDGDGIVTTAINASGGNVGLSIIQQQDGKLAVAGYSNNGSNNDIVILRYNIGGTLDVSFDTDGIAITDFTSTSDVARSLIQQQDGKLTVAGRTTATGKDIALARYNSDGTLDTTLVGDAGFANGTVTTDIDSNDDDAYSIIQQTDSKLVVAGFGTNVLYTYSAVLRYNLDGTLDTSFGTH